MTREGQEIVAFLANPNWQKLKKDVDAKVALCIDKLKDPTLDIHAIRVTQGIVEGLEYLTDFEHELANRLNELKEKNDG